MSKVIELKDVDDVLTGLVAVKVWAPWCGPCLAMDPIFEKLADEFTNIKFMKCNMDDVPEFGRIYNIKSIPTFTFFKDGIVKDQITGACRIVHLRGKLKNL